MFSREFCEIFKNTFFHRIPLVAASALDDSYLSTKFERKANWKCIMNMLRMNKRMNEYMHPVWAVRNDNSLIISTITFLSFLLFMRI